MVGEIPVSRTVDEVKGKGYDDREKDHQHLRQARSLLVIHQRKRANITDL